MKLELDVGKWGRMAPKETLYDPNNQEMKGSISQLIFTRTLA